MLVSPTPTKSAMASSFTTTITLLALELSRTPRKRSHVISITMPKAGRLTRIGMPATRGAESSRPCTPASALRSAVR